MLRINGRDVSQTAAAQTRTASMYVVCSLVGVKDGRNEALDDDEQEKQIHIQIKD